MKRRVSLPPAEDTPMPPELAMGPRHETWDRQHHPRRRDQPSSVMKGFDALRNWQFAVEDWATATGWAHEGRPASNAYNLARTRRPWSSQFLRSRGFGAMADYLEGKTADRPNHLVMPHGWWV